MSLDNLLRDYARQDLQRFFPAGHYWLRDHEPMADRELIEPLIKEPVRFGLTPRENLAANALSDLTIYTIRSRAIWVAAYPARDSDDPTPAPGTTFDQEREIAGRREVYRRSALIYARMLGDSQLIEYYQPLKQIEPLHTSSRVSESESLVVQIDVGDGTLRDALPVRAIPYVTGWRANGGISPDVVATSLRPSTDGHGERLNGIFSYRLLAGKPYQISPQEWDMVAVQLAGFSAELEKQFPSSDQNKNDAAGYATWQTNATEKLPAGVFVWLDELKTAYGRFFDWQARVLMDESIVVPELNLAPLLLSVQTKKMVLEGFKVEQIEGLNTMTINGRKVVPIRLLPFASHWLTAMTVAQSLAHKNPNEDLKLTGYYQSGNTLIPMRPRQWDELVERLLLLEKELKHDEKSKFEDANYMRYTSESRAMLPVDVVVDCDELKAAYFNVFLDDASDGPGYLEIRPGDNDLDFNCYLNQEERCLVFGGDTTQTKQKPEIDSVGTTGDVAATSQQKAPFIDTAPEQDTAKLVPVLVDGIDFTMVATRQQLIDAFGTFTGMDKSWFDNLTTSPKLMAARKCKGQGGRNRAEPLFCPYEVMQWLADPKRKKGKKINETTAWRLLKSHFPKVHNQYSIGDPSAD